MPPGVTFTSISASSGGRFSLALDVEGDAWAWGRGALGTGDEEERWTPTRIIMPGGVAFTGISAGWTHSLALDVGGAA
jgi:hypothetical protein